MEAFKGIETKTVHVHLEDDRGKVILDEDVTFPKDWDYNDILIVASRYLCNSAKRKKELSYFDMIERVSRRLAQWAAEVYGWSKDQEEAFAEELAWFQVHRYFAFNSPVYFNVGLDGSELGHACFILDVEDNLESIYAWIRQEMLIFRCGSGVGVNLSKLRGSVERISSGGYASGPVSFLKVSDASAAEIRSGGRVRRAAKLALLDCTHIDLIDFIWAKVKEERKARILVDAGAIKDTVGEIPLQATNLSVGVTDAFMHAVRDNKPWVLRGVKDNVTKERPAEEIFKQITQAAWEAGCPGLQFLDTINAMNPVAYDPRYRIRCSNPCGEYMGPPFTACNLASHNLMAYVGPDGSFNYELFDRATRCLVRAMTALSHKGDYPTEQIRRETQRFHNIGIGYSNLAGLLVNLGLPYDSDEAAFQVKVLTALLQAYAIKESQRIAAEIGPYEAYHENSHTEVINTFQDRALEDFYGRARDALGLVDVAREVWKDLDPHLPAHNAQYTLLAPTGTTSFLLGCSDSTGIEPLYSLRVYKRLMDGKTIALTPKAVSNYLKRALGEKEAQEVIEYILETGDVPPYLPSRIKDVLKVSIHRDPSQRVDPVRRLRTVAAAQRYLSAAISLTVNLPQEATPEDVWAVYWTAWELGLKGVTIYRDGSKAVQVLYSRKSVRKPKRAQRVPLPEQRQAKVKKFRVATSKGYIITGEYEDGSLGEVFVKIAKEGSTLAGLSDALAVALSVGLQHGVPLEEYTRRFRGTRFEPSGFTGEEDIKSAASIVDYLAQYLERQYLGKDDKAEEVDHHSGVVCHKCGAMMQRKGSCYLCTNCGETSGSCE